MAEGAGRAVEEYGDTGKRGKAEAWPEEPGEKTQTSGVGPLVCGGTGRIRT